MKAAVIINNKSEWHHSPIIRVVTSSGLPASQGEDQALALALPAGQPEGKEGGEVEGGDLLKVGDGGKGGLQGRADCNFLVLFVTLYCLLFW